MTTRRSLLKTSAGALAAASLSRWLYAADAPRPNIVLILSDDLGIGGFSCYGGDGVKTPRVDELARTGMRFEHCFSMPLCGPTRACLMTGRYAFRTGMTTNNTGAVVRPENEPCIARTLKGAGYVTGFAGKWHQLEYLDSPEDAARWGWDEYLRWQKKTGERYWKPAFVRDGKPVPITDASYGPDLLHDYCADFMARHKDRPFFLYYPMVSVHAPILRTPDSAAGADKRAIYDDNVKYLDKLLGKVADELDRLKLRENTLILYTSDNGTPGRDTIGSKAIEGVKGSMLEGGVRVPLIANWKGRIAPGQVCPDLVDMTDFYPTVADVVGAKMPDKPAIDGRSFAARLLGQEAKPRQWVHVQLGARRYIRDPKWKLYNDGTLCDMANAPFGEVVVAPDRQTPEAAEARKRLQAAMDGLK
jgi:arylsulfatase A